eukprot:4973254-Amphidinium_carterae.1
MLLSYDAEHALPALLCAWQRLGEEVGHVRSNLCASAIKGLGLPLHGDCVMFWVIEMNCCWSSPT